MSAFEPCQEPSSIVTHAHCSRHFCAGLELYALTRFCVILSNFLNIYLFKFDDTLKLLIFLLFLDLVLYKNGLVHLLYLSKSIFHTFYRSQQMPKNLKMLVQVTEL